MSGYNGPHCQDEIARPDQVWAHTAPVDCRITTSWKDVPLRRRGYALLPAPRSMLSVNPEL
jgi:hypothetical protein